MPKFEKGSQEAKDHMAMLRAKRGQKTGKGVADPPPPPPPNREERMRINRPPPLNLTEAQRIQREEAVRRAIAEADRERQRRANADRERQRPPEREGQGLGWGDVKRKLKKEGKKVKRVIKKASNMAKAVERTQYPSKVKKLLTRNGMRVITSATINRKPVKKKLTDLLNVLSFGQFKRNVDSQPYDDLFHLSIVLHTEDGKTIMVEKNQVINMGMTPKKGGETYNITPFSTGKTLDEVMERTREKMGDARFYSYSARDNNCQDFILAILQANGMGDADEFAFVKQDTKEIFKGLNTLSTVADFITDLAGDVVFIKGKGGKVSRPRQIAPTEQPIILIEDKTPDKSKWRRKVERLEQDMESIAPYLLGQYDTPEKEKWRVMYRTLLQEAQAYRKAIIDPPADTDDIVIEGLGVGVSKAQIEYNKGQADRMRAYKIEQQRQALYAHRKKAIADDIRKMKQSALERRKRMFGKGAGASVPQSQLRDEDIMAIALMVIRDPLTPPSTMEWLIDMWVTNSRSFVNFYRYSRQYRSFRQGMMSAEDSVSDWILSVPLSEQYRMYDDEGDEVENRLDYNDGAGYDSTSETERLSSEEDTDPRMSGTGAGASTPFPPPPPPSNPNTRQVFATNDLLRHISSFAPPTIQVRGVRVNMRDPDAPLGYRNWRSRVFEIAEYYDDGTDLAIRPTTGDTRRFYDEEGGEVFPSDFIPTNPSLADEANETPNQGFFPNPSFADEENEPPNQGFFPNPMRGDRRRLP
jgi:hypothetical protein